MLTSDGEEYQWSKVTSTVGNLIIGKLYVDHSGIMKVRNLSSGLVARLRFKEQGLIMDRNPHQVCTGSGMSRHVDRKLRGRNAERYRTAIDTEK